jgi:C1A family cysteine protease
MENLINLKMGWLRDYPDIRDYTSERDVVDRPLTLLGQKDSIKEMLKKTGVLKTTLRIPATVDLRSWCSPVEDQHSLGSCTAQAGVGILEYYERRAYGKHIDASRLFLYKATRNLLRWTGDTGAFIRSTMGAMVLFGVPPEEYWMYTDRSPDFDNEPPAFCYAFAQNYQAISYYRLDPSGTPKTVLLDRIKNYLAAGLPSMFGFTVYNSMGNAYTTGKIPFPYAGDKILGGHAVVAVGYDDNMKIKHPAAGAPEFKGALLIRNSWGTGWGPLGGYLWLPYQYVLSGLAVDWWSLLRYEWIETGNFKA